MEHILSQTRLAAVACTAWFGTLTFRDVIWCCRWVTLGAWLIVAVLWVRSICRYNRLYREYEQNCREYKKCHGEFTEDLRLVQKRLSDFDNRHRMTLNPLRRLGLLAGNVSVGSSALLGKSNKRINRIENFFLRCIL